MSVPAAPPHRPVMCDRVVEWLAPAAQSPGAVIVDATVGAGGHSAALLEACPQAQLLGLDRDQQALDLAEACLAEFATRVTLTKAVFDELNIAADAAELGQFNAVLFDLGVSSMQLDQAERGFAYSQDAPLDMRMDPTTGLSAADVVATYSIEALAGLLRAYADERWAGRIARALVQRRQTAPITRTAELAELVRNAIPAAGRRTGGHPAKRTFQALRIEVNGEWDCLERALPAAVERLAPGGRIAVLSYHSGEDRMVKYLLGQATQSTAPPGLPVEPEETKPPLRWLTRGGERPCEQELAGNRRSASARLRVAEKIDRRRQL